MVLNLAYIRIKINFEGYYGNLSEDEVNQLNSI